MAALLANIGIAVIKFIAFLITGSSSMLAEAVHSVADSGNQGLLLLGGRRSRRRATAEHPFGFGRDRYVYGFLVALVLFTVGGLFALYEGIHKISDPHHLDSPLIADRRAGGGDRPGELSFRTAIRESREPKGDASWPQFIRRAKVPELPVVLLEDFAALIGPDPGALGVGLERAAGRAGLGRHRHRGDRGAADRGGGDPDHRDQEPAARRGGQPRRGGPDRGSPGRRFGQRHQRVIHHRTMHLGPEEVLVAAKVSMSPDSSLADVATAINAAEARIRAAEPAARVIYLEPDIYHPEGPRRPSIQHELGD